MPLTTIKGSNIDAVLTNTQLNTTGTASSANILPGTFVWSSGSRTAMTNYAASDPATPAAGDVWYQAGNIKVASNQNILTGIWSSSGNLPRSEEQAPACGQAAAGLLAGGENSGYKNITNSYDGTAWNTLGGTLATARANAPLIGNLNAAIFCGGQAGSVLDGCEEFDGLSWSAGGTLTDDLTSGVAEGFGILTAAVCAGGSLSASVSAVTQLYNGTSWSTGNSCLTTKNYAACAGKDSAGLVTGGSAPAYTTETEEYDGTSWSAGGALNTGRSQLAGAGTQTAALAFAGSTGSDSTVTEEYDGTAWTNVDALTTARRSAGGNGSQSRAFVTGGYGGAYLNSTEDWTKPQTQYYDV